MPRGTTVGAPVTTLSRLRSGSPAMTGLAVASVIATVAVLAVLAFDQRVLLGAPLWFKPLKFFISTAIYGVTLAWLLTRVSLGRSRLARGAFLVGAVAWTIELALIATQAVRGVPSHFNIASGTDVAIFAVMAVTATILWITNIVVAGLVLAERDLDPVWATAITAGLGLAILGMTLAFLMPLQDSALAGRELLLQGGHAVGVADGGAGLPLLNWSTEGGDLRVPHFVGLHGLQVMPLLAVVAARLPDRDQRQRVRLLRVGALGYAGLTLLLAWQALRGQPLLRPDGLTLIAAGVLAIAVVAGVGLRPRRAQPV